MDRNRFWEYNPLCFPLIRGTTSDGDNRDYRNTESTSGTGPLEKGEDRGIGIGAWIPYSTRLTPFSKSNRKEMTKPERILWYEVLNKRKLGYKFLRQKPLVQFIADFYCSKLRLVIEVDGESHKSKKAYDSNRTQVLKELEIKVIRFKNEEVLFNLDKVRNSLLTLIKNREVELRIHRMKIPD